MMMIQTVKFLKFKYSYYTYIYRPQIIHTRHTQRGEEREIQKEKDSDSLLKVESIVTTYQH